VFYLRSFYQVRTFLQFVIKVAVRTEQGLGGEGAEPRVREVQHESGPRTQETHKARKFCSHDGDIHFSGHSNGIGSPIARELMNAAAEPEALRTLKAQTAQRH
jgi:hypothetical protein